jgi:hypothetical protein
MGEWMYRSTFFLTSALAGGELSTSRPGRFTPGERGPGNHWIGGWVGPRVGLDDVEKRKFLTLPGFKLHLSVVHPVASRYTDSPKAVAIQLKRATETQQSNCFWTYMMT